MSGLVLFAPRWVEGIPDQMAPPPRVVLLLGPMAAAKAAVTDAARVSVLPDASFADTAIGLMRLLKAEIAAARGAPVLVQVAVPAEDAPLSAAVAALLRTFEAEAPHILGQCVGFAAGTPAAEIARLLAADAATADRVIRHVGGRRETRDVVMLETDAPVPSPWRVDGVTLITGGTGGLGLVFARDIAARTPGAAVVLVGRAPLDDARQAVLAELRRLGLRADYHAADVADEAALRRLLDGVRAAQGPITGVLHAAGVIRDAYLLNKDIAEASAVIAAKAGGAVALDAATADDPLDFFVAFSSLAGLTGNPGQADYAMANGFLDGFPARRNALVAAGRRSGRTLSINWPLWRDGGMRIAEAAAQTLREDHGLEPLSNAEGLAAFARALHAGCDQVVVAKGEPKAIEAHLRGPRRMASAAAAPGETVASRRAVAERLRQLLAEVTKRPAATIDAEEPFASYGIDSLMVLELNRRLAGPFGPLSKTLFFEHHTVNALAAHLAERHAAACRAWTGASAAPASAPSAAARPAQRPAADEPIAIVGMAGRFPQAADLTTFWRNLEQGRDSIGEVPSDRWPLDGFYLPSRHEAVSRGLSYSRWGGFVDGFADFDPLFFGIAPREALAMDPQERMFLEVCWQALEDAGITRADLARRHGGRVGVFAGVTKNEHALYGPPARASFASVANRVSFVFDLNGPSVPIDTMCSSSLTAVHQACEAIRRGECELAMAGGVNLYLHPSAYVDLCAAGMLSDDGRCRSFGRGGTGFVPGEGAACVLLKPLSRAEADGDRIEAVIRASAVNHGGHTNGYTVPNPAAQRALLRDVLERASVDARSVSYVEAHGTGTELGDPIEVEGLTQAFRVDTEDLGFCALGSLKSNIGHLEAAAGIAGVVKTVLQMRHKALAPSLHADEVNPNIDLARTPFVLQRRLAPWPTPPCGARRATVSSFGAGGANACVLIEEYVPAATSPTVAEPQVAVLSARSEDGLRTQAGNLLAWIEARSERAISADPVVERVARLTGVAPSDLDEDVPLADYGLGAAQLRQLAADLDGMLVPGAPPIDATATIAGIAANLDGGAGEDGAVDLAALCMTLQTGREAMEHRLAMRIADVGTLRAALRAVAAGAEPVCPTWRGRVTAGREHLAVLNGADDVARALDSLLQERDLDRLAGLWVRGLHIDWQRLHRPSRPRPLSLPTYPFARRRLWIGDEVAAQPKAAPVPAASAETSPAAEAADEAAVRAAVIDALADALDLRPDEIDARLAFADYGLDSILGVRFTHELAGRLSIALEVTAIFDHATAERLTRHIVDTLAPKQPARPSSVPAAVTTAAGDEPIAVIGMSGRFPQSPNLDALWVHLRAGDELLGPVERWPLPDSVACRRGGFLSDIDRFDSLFFNISGAEAAYMDPQQRLFLEEAWAALEDAGHAGDAAAGTACGVYVGCCGGDYQDLFLGSASPQSLCGNMASLIPARIAYYLDLKGPALAIDTACSSSLVAIHAACRDLRAGEAEMALAGGVFVQATPKLYLGAGRAGMLSPTGRCWSFDSRADGFVPGEGVGVLVLKRLSAALADGDTVRGLIVGSGINHDGTTNGITAPSARSQEDLLKRVHRDFGIDPADIGLLEAHGTGTQLGDPIEFRALSATFADVRNEGACALGSIKTNIGHGQFAAGAAGTMKVLLALEHDEIPPSLNFASANPAIRLDAGPLRVNTHPRPWPRSGRRRLGAVSSFGASGTNAHVVLGEPPEAIPSAYARTRHLVVLSARSAEQLRAQAERLVQHCRARPELRCGDIAFTLLAGRKHFEHRLALVAETAAELAGSLEDWLRHAAVGRVASGEAQRQPPAANDDLYAPQRLRELADAFVAGGTVDWRRLYAGDRPRRVPLPTYPFAGMRHWLPGAAAPSPEQAAPLRLSPLESGDYRIDIARDAFFLADHLVQGRPVVPGVMVLEILRLALVQEGDVQALPQVRNLAWLRPLTAEGDLPLVLTLAPDEGGERTFRIARGQQVFSQGTVSTRPATAPARMERPATRATVGAEACYAAIRGMGIVHGRRLQALQAVHIGDGQAVADLLPPEGLPPSPVQPALFDAAIQASVAFALDARDRDGAPVPFAVDEIHIFRDCGEARRAVLRRPRADGDGALSGLDIDLCTADGTVCAQIRGCTSRVLRTETTPDAEAMMLTPVWEPLAPSSTEPVPTDGVTVLVGATAARQAALASVWPSARTLDVSEDSDPAALAETLRAMGAPSHVVFVADVPALRPDDEALIAGQERLALTALRLIRGLLAAGLETRAVSWTVITVAAQGICHGDTPRPAAAGLLGLFGSMAKEYPQWPLRLVDLDVDEPWPLSELAALPFGERGTSYARRRGTWLSPALLPLRASAPEMSPNRKGRVYVVIGGAGGIGHAWSEAVAREHGAQVVWIGRRPADAAIAARQDAVAAVGPRPDYIQADAGDRAALTAARDEVLRRHGRIDGVVHSAIALRDQTLARMDDATLRAVLAGKVDVSVRMAQVFDLTALDFVLFFSSIQSFARMPGQGNYAAGCTFKDAFAHCLSAQGVRARVMNWGYWGQVGVVATAEHRARMARAGLDSIEPTEAMAGLDVLLAGTQPQIALVKLRPGATIETMRRDAVVAAMPAATPSLAAAVATLPPQDTAVRDIAARVGNQMSDLDAVMARLLWAQMNAAGLFAGATWQRERIAKAMPEMYGRWLDETLRVLVRHGYLTSDGRIIAAPEQADSAWAAWEAAASPLRHDADRRAHVALAEAMLRALPDILCGRRPATQVMFPNSSLELVEGVYRDNLVADYFNAVLCDGLVAMVRERLAHEPQARLRLLEVGAGTGGTALRVFERLKPFEAGIAEYCFTDLSKAFLLNAERNYRRHAPYLTTRIFNLDRPAEEQDIAAGAYDFVIATNVLHATRDIRTSLRNVKGAMKAGGVLLLNELTDNVLFSHLTFGLLQGWWAYDDAGLRIEGTPALTPESWAGVLATEGFRRIAFPAEAARRLGQQIIVGESDGLVRQAGVAVPALPASAPVATPVAAPLASPTLQHLGAPLEERGRQLLRSLIAEAIAVPAEQIGWSVPLERYGVDSILVLQIVAHLRTIFPEVSSTLLFEVNTVDGLVQHFLAHHPDRLANALGAAAEPAPPPAPPAAPEIASPVPTTTDDGSREIAIVGLSGRYPGAADVRAFWDNLIAGRDCIGEIPPERWDWRAHYDPRRGRDGASCSRFGGFLDGADRFDPLFFNISPAEAERMDPQERLFLQEAYASIEDAGYAPRSFGRTGRVGVFVGVMNAHYPTRAAFWSVANRVSYLLDLKGPSLAVDTACSSSLTALHLAVESLRAGRCDAAVAGGVNLILHPRHMANLSALGMLSPDGRCRAFGAEADGIADGEGVGALVLKPLDKARADGDHIYGVIVGSAVNSGGRTSSYTAPSPAAHAELILDALKDAALEARRVSYVEAHGTGTPLGDPIEVEGLTRAFRAHTADAGFCAIGSAKSNIGHGESAAGVAGVTKVLLQLRHGRLAPTLHAAAVNPHIDFAATPFVLQTEAAEWRRRDGLPLVAGVSSFGAGGANAHVLIREEVAAAAARPPAPSPVVIVLSARKADRLTEAARRLLAFVEDQPAMDAADLADLAYTLQVGRDAMAERLAFVVDGTDELKRALRAYLQDGSGALRGALAPDEAERPSDGVQNQPWQVAAMWVKGFRIDWPALYTGWTPRRISLPTYPFTGERYWMDEPAQPAPARLHPLVHRNVSDLRGLRYRTRFTASDSLLADHLAGGRPILPAAASLEMARAALALASDGQHGAGLRGVRWLRPFTPAAEGSDLDVVLTRHNDGRVAFEIVGADGAVYACGESLPGSAGADRIDLAAIAARTTLARPTPEACYAALAAAGIVHGATLRGLVTVQAGEAEVLAEIARRAAAGPCDAGLVLDPVLVDAALQAGVGLLAQPDGGIAALDGGLPVSVEAVEVARALPDRLFVWVRSASGGIDVTLCDADGNVLARLTGLATQQPAARTVAAPRPAAVSADSSAVASYLRGLVAATLKLPPDDIDPHVALETYGLDSVMVLRLTDQMAETFGPLPKTLFYEYRCLADLAGHFATTLPEAAARLGAPAAPAEPAPRETARTQADGDGDIAIIGLAGRYPDAPDLDTFWSNLRDGRDSVGEIPSGRWDHAPLYAADRMPGKTRSRWGGFLDGVDLFDAAFFNMLPADAELTDPQERLFVETVHHAVEDAGHTRASLARSGDVGVFVGVMYEEYQLYGVEETLRGRPMALSGSPASIANRVSYLFDFHGPSMAVDTMCSSSLSALHLACQALRSGDCGVAVAGGVNLSLHPNKYLMLGRGGFESAHGRCAAFGAGGDGYVPSEGVGAVVLKPLSQALTDGDRIHGVIKATALNHGGKTNGYTVPDPAAQEKVVAAALARAGIDARSISYIEAHGTGTVLGDPIEIAGLTRAFRRQTDDAGFCAIGSVKSNIGHCESAAGIAGLTKVLLQMRHRTLVPSLHAEEINPHVAFDGSPFVLQRRLAAWSGPAPLRAGISSFGAGGANAHVVVEEPPVKDTPADGAVGPVAIVLSARSAEQVRAIADRLRRHLADAESHREAPRLDDVAFTLQCGREALGYRLGFVADTLTETLAILAAVAEGNTPSEARSGQARSGAAHPFEGAADPQAMVAHWVEGGWVDWPALHRHRRPRRVGLPLYPFARQSFWAPSQSAFAGLAPAQVPAASEPGDATVLLRPVWRAADSKPAKTKAGRHSVILCGFADETAAMLQRALSGAECLVVPPATFVACAEQALAAAQSIARAAVAPNLVQFVTPVGPSPALHSALAALAGTLRQEVAGVHVQAIAINASLPASEIAQLLVRDAATADLVIRHEGSRSVRAVEEFSGTSQQPPPWRDRGVYLITGGAGGLGLVFARAIAASVRDPVLVLVGRTPLDAVRERAIAELAGLGARARYVALDVGDRVAVATMVDRVRAEFGSISGVLHSAGIIRDAYLIKKDLADAGAVLSAKVAGAEALDDATRADVLDVFACFASLAGVTGNGGQADYAMANGWLDGFAAWRNRLVEAGARHGRTVSIDWPLWTEGGMRVNEAALQAMRRGYGLSPLPTAAGLQAFTQALGSGADQMLVAHGEPRQIRARLAGGVEAARRAADQAAGAAPAPAVPPTADTDVMGQVRAILAQVLRMDAEEIAADQPLGDYGFDSISFTDLAGRCSERFAVEVTPTVFFSCATPAELADHIRLLLCEAEPPPSPRAEPTAAPPAAPRTDEPVAIIGASGVLPGAAGLDAFWDNMLAGRDCIGEVPASRWDWRAIDGDPRLEPGRTDIHWGGFIDGVAEFDPLFFGITPREAELMDPHQRLLMTHVWKAIEDAGHAPDSLAGSRTAVFLATGRSDYALLAARHGMVLDERSPTGGVASLGPNRISHMLNLRGPSEPIETACSSALVAVHRGVEAIHSGCSMAIVGAVNTILTPSGHISFGRAGMLSRDGRCKTFSADADGYVRSEGCGVLVLKPLRAAEADGDQIYGLIRATGVNHGGRGASLTAPTARSQAELIEEVVAAAGVDPRTIGFIEAHGTGTRLGDPVEIEGISTAFRNLYAATGAAFASGPACGIGSAKSHVGHLEMAAGMASIFKVLLQIRHHTLIGNLHCREINPLIDLAGTPFHLQRETQPWPAPSDGGRPAPRRAGVSSFGFGGVNAHAVIEEYLPPAEVAPVQHATALIVLSARTDERLRAAAAALRDWVTARLDTPEPGRLLADMAYTLQVGRNAMAARLGFAADSLPAVVDMLRRWLAGETALPGLHQGTVRRGVRATLPDPAAGTDALLAAWTAGAAVDWERLRAGGRRRRISLPSYPMAQDRYWIIDSVEPASQTRQAPLHPLVQYNASVGEIMRYTSRFSGAEPFLRDHVVAGDPVMPGAGYIEMARAAVADATRGTHGHRLTEIGFERLASPGTDGLVLEVDLRQGRGDAMAFEIAGQRDGQRIVHARGLSLPGRGAPERLDLNALRAATRAEVGSEAFYARFDRLGLTYGPTHRGLRHAWLGDNLVLAEIVLPPEAQGGGYMLPPALVDAALQACMGLFPDTKGQDDRSGVPGLIAEVSILAPLPDRLWAVVRGNGAGEPTRIDIALCDDAGDVLARIVGLRMIAIGGRPRASMVMMEPVWREAAPGTPDSRPPQPLVLVSARLAAAAELRRRAPADMRVSELPGDVAMPLPAALAAHVREAVAAVQEIARGTGPVALQIVVPADGEESLLTALAGLARTAETEISRLSAQVVAVPATIAAPDLKDLLKREAARLDDKLVRYEGGRRFVRDLTEITERTPSSPWRDRGVYLISGGGGGLGIAFAEHIARQTIAPVLILIGRSPRDERHRAIKARLHELGAIASYHAVDVSDAAAVAALAAQIRAEHGPLTGVLHAAGVIDDAYIAKKRPDSIETTLAPKVAGVLALDAATRDDPLEIFGCFSSIAGELGNAGQADYAVANAFLDRFAGWRNGLAAVGLRRGRTLSVNWPLWDGAGMGVDKATLDLLRSRYGVEPLPVAAGLDAFDAAWGSGRDQVVVAWGDAARLRRLLSGPRPTVVEEKRPSAADAETLVPRLTAIVANLAKVSPQDMDPEAEFGEYGLDSIVLTELAARLSSEYGIDVSPTLFFECPSVGDLARHLAPTIAPQPPAPAARPAEMVQDLARLVAELVKVAPEEIDPAAALTEYGLDSVSFSELASRINAAFDLTVSPTVFFEHATLDELAGHLAGRMPVRPAPTATTAKQPAEPLPATHTPAPARTTPSDAVAIIGASGSFPMAADLDAFWRNLVHGQDCIVEIPPERWDWRAIDGDPRLQPNRTNIRWGGFLEGIDRFDPAFFGLSPGEAETMDPQQRLLMMHVWAALENAGYAPGSLAGSRTGLFIATMSSGYGALVQASAKGGEGRLATGSVASVGPNRMSHMLDLRGPSEPIETACSSSLVAVHRGVEALRHGDCDMTVVGGVNVMPTADGHIGFSQAGMLSPEGRCKTFSRHADGYARGEGVGMVVLKRLADAEADGDTILGVIRATGVGHGGRANSLTAPNPRAQAELIRDVHRRAGIDPRTVTFVEAHGTGTRLGDPVEIEGLKQAFVARYHDVGAAPPAGQHCGIGAVKTQIGHLELAAGIAGLLKVLLQMRHATLVGNLHGAEVNPLIDMGGSPFYLVGKTCPWTTPHDADGRPVPRLAGISSFGFGGVNTHVLVEEYLAPTHPAEAAVGAAAAHVVVLSARDGERLAEAAANLRTWLAARSAEPDGIRLSDLAYTLQVGRDAMVARLGCVVSSLAELDEKLAAHLAGGGAVAGLFVGTAGKHDRTGVLDQGDTAKLVDGWLAEGRLDKVVRAWVAGIPVDWTQLDRSAKRRRVPLPTYPFARERYWIAPASVRPQPAAAASVAAAAPDGGVPSVQAIVAQVLGVDAAAIEAETPLRTLGLDSIGMMQVGARLLEAFPVLEAGHDGDALLQAGSVAALSAVIDAARARGDGAPPAPSSVSLDGYGPAQKRDSVNRVVKRLRLEGDAPLAARGRLVVDETHPFFFDHPLDHVSGMLMAEAMSQVAKTAFLYQGRLSGDCPIFVKSLRLTFPFLCQKEDGAEVEADMVEALALGGAVFEARVRQAGRITAEARMTLFAADEPATMATALPTAAAVDKVWVNKRRAENVLLAGLVRDGDGARCRLALHPEASFLRDFPGGMVDGIVLAEAVRQCLRAVPRLVVGEASGEASDQGIGLLKDIVIDLDRPISRDEPVSLAIARCAPLVLGGASHLQIAGHFIAGDGYEAIGRFSTSALSISKALQQAWGVQREVT